MGVLRENRYVNDYVKNNLPNALSYGRMRVGRKLTNIGIERLWPDKILIEDGKVIIIEAKIKPTSAAIGQLNEYARLFPETPEFFFVKDYTIRKMILTTRPDRVIEEMAAASGIEYVVYLPDWLKFELEAALEEEQGL